MAAKTFTYTVNMSNVPAKLHAGLQALAFDFNSGANKLGTVSDMVLLGKIPNGAVITDGLVSFGAQKNAAQTYTLLLLAVDASGTFSTLATLSAASGSITSNASTAQNYTIIGPTKVSLSDDRAVQYAVLALNCTVGGSETTSSSFQGHVKYVSDGRSL